MPQGTHAQVWMMIACGLCGQGRRWSVVPTFLVWSRELASITSCFLRSKDISITGVGALQSLRNFRATPPEISDMSSAPLLANSISMLNARQVDAVFLLCLLLLHLPLVRWITAFACAANNPLMHVAADSLYSLDGARNFRVFLCTKMKPYFFVFLQL